MAGRGWIPPLSPRYLGFAGRFPAGHAGTWLIRKPTTRPVQKMLAGSFLEKAEKYAERNSEDTLLVGDCQLFPTRTIFATITPVMVSGIVWI